MDPLGPRGTDRARFGEASRSEATIGRSVNRPRPKALAHPGLLGTPGHAVDGIAGRSRDLVHRYADVGSVTEPCAEWEASAIGGKRQVDDDANEAPGKPLDRGALCRLLQHRLHREVISRAGMIRSGEHLGIVDEAPIEIGTESGRVWGRAVEPRRPRSGKRRVDECPKIPLARNGAAHKIHAGRPVSL